MRLPLKTLLALLLLATASAALASETLEGRWRLVEQRYGEGGANQAGEMPSLRLEFSLDGERADGRVWAARNASDAAAWPAFVVAGEPRVLSVEERRLDAAAGEVFARYRVQPAPGDGTVLEITEGYRLSPDGESLLGTVHVKFVRDGEKRGGYVLHRRFAREP